MTKSMGIEPGPHWSEAREDHPLLWEVSTPSTALSFRHNIAKSIEVIAVTYHSPINLICLETASPECM